MNQLPGNAIPIGRRAARSLTVLTALGAGLCGLAATAGAQVQAGPEIYHGASAAAAGVTLASWGSGTVAEDTKLIYSGSESLRITTQGPFQGASISLATPVDLGPYLGNNAAYIQFAIIPPVLSTESNGPGAGPYGGKGAPGFAGPGAGSSGPYGAGSPAGGRQPGSPPYGGAGGGQQTTGTLKFQKPHAMENLRVVLVTASGRAVSFLAPIDSATSDGQWKLVSYPVPQISGLKGDDAQIKEVRIFGDEPGTMHIGKISVVTDASPITIQPIDPKIVDANVTYRYTASASAGITPVRVTWDWDASDGIQEESIGKSVVHSFHKSGDYIVTVTASDLYGSKAPTSTTFKVHVP